MKKIRHDGPKENMRIRPRQGREKKRVYIREKEK